MCVCVGLHSFLLWFTWNILKSIYEQWFSDWIILTIHSLFRSLCYLYTHFHVFIIAVAAAAAAVVLYKHLFFFCLTSFILAFIAIRRSNVWWWWRWSRHIHKLMSIVKLYKYTEASIKLTYNGEKNREEKNESIRKH